MKITSRSFHFLAAAALVANTGCFQSSARGSKEDIGSDPAVDDSRAESFELAEETGEDIVEIPEAADFSCDPPAEEMTWLMTLGGPFPVFINDIVENECGEIFVTGYAEPSEEGAENLLVAKISPGGALIWQRTLDGGGRDFGWSINMRPEGSISVIGQSEFSSSIGTIIVDTTRDGTLLRQGIITTSNSGSVACRDALMQSDDARIFVGWATAPSTMGNGWISAVGADGSILWQRAIGLSGGISGLTSYGREISMTRDGMIIMTGWIGPPFTEYGMWIVALDGDGEVRWQKKMGPGQNEAANAAIETRDGDIIIAGGARFVSDLDTDSCDVKIIKLTSAGELVWAKTLDYSRFDRPGTIIETEDGGFTLTGTTGASMGDSNLFLLKFGADDEIVWQKVYRLPGPDEVTSVIGSRDGGFIIVGTMVEETYSEGFVMKVDGSGEIPAGCDLVEEAGFAAVDFDASVVDASAVPFPTEFTVGEGALESSDADLAADFICPE